MNDDKKSKGFLKSISELSFIKKLKSIKHIEIIIVVIFVLILLLICFSGNNTFGFLGSQAKGNAVATTENQTYLSTTEYVNSLEGKLKKLLSKIENAGDVEVMISIDGSSEIVFATDEIITTSGQTTEKQSKIIFVETGGEERPIIINEKLPSVNGVVVISSGAKNTKVKLDIISAIQTLLDIDSGKIEVFVGK